METAFNSNFIVIGNPSTESEILLKNIRSNRVFRMTNIEYLIIKKFSENNSITETHRIFEKEYNLDIKVIESLVSVSKKNEFILSQENESPTDRKEIDHLSDKVSYIIYKIFTYLTSKKSRFVLELKGNFNLIKLFSWKTEELKSPIPKTLAYFQYSLGIAAIILLIFNIRSINLLYMFYSIGQISLLNILLIALPISLLISLIHEYSHFITYKYLGGMQNEMGLALMYRFLPIFYTSTEDMILWISKTKKIQVAAAGLISDLIFLLFLLATFDKINIGLASSVSGFVIVGLLIKMLYNANPFAPGSDMYFIVCDLFDLQSPFLNAHNSIKSTIKSRKIKSIKIVDFIYSILCYISIFSYSTLILGMITLPFWIDFVI